MEAVHLITTDKPEFSVSASRSIGESGPAMILKIQAQAFELNVWVDDSELDRLASVRTARWGDRTSVCIGTSANARAHWYSDGSGVSIMFEHDDETWDILAVIPIAAFDALLADIRRELSGGGV